MGRYFGTDGIRGIAGTELTPILSYKTAAAFGSILKKEIQNPKVIIGSDTRNSKDLILSAMVSGLSFCGVDVVDIGIIPTPALAYLIPELNANAGIVISASHNPYNYNGIKIISEKGHKLPDEKELEIEKIIENFNLMPCETFGIFSYYDKADEIYIKHIIDTADTDISDISVIVDCANGAAYKTAKKIFPRLCKNCKIIYDNPDGKNINNNCGSTYIEKLSGKVVSEGADIGFAFDGDADRCLAVDKNGRVIEGDKILATLAVYLKKQNRLNNNCLVATVMSNLGLIEKMSEYDIDVLTTKVGDKYVLDKMLQDNLSLGGENSGHIIISEKATTGDGQLTAVSLLCAMKFLHLNSDEIFDFYNSYPQKLINVVANDLQKAKLMKDEIFLDDIKKAEQSFKGKGRILVRPSGTEALIRILVEGKNLKDVNNVAANLEQSTKIRLHQIF